MNVRAKLVVGFSIIVALLWLVAFFATTGYRDLNQRFMVEEEEFVSETLFITHIEGLASEAYRGALDYVFRGSEEAKLNTLSLLDGLAGIRETDSPRGDGTAQELFAEIDRFRYAIGDVITAADSGATMEDLMVMDEAIVLPALLSLQQAADFQKTLNSEALAVAEVDFDEAYESGLRFIIIGIALITLAILMAAILMNRSIVRPLHALRRGTEMVARGNLGFKVGTKAKDEIGQLSRAFDQMTEGLTNTMTSVDNLNKEIAERRKVEKALQRSEEKFRVGFEHSRDAIFLADAGTGILLDVNQAGCDLLGLPREEIVGMHQSELHPPEMAEKHKKLFRENLKKGNAMSEDLLVQRADGTLVPVDVSASLIELDGKPTMQGVFRDITARKQAEEALRETQEFNTSMLENAPNPICVIDPDTSIRYANPAFEKLTGFSIAEITGIKAPYPWWPEEDVPGNFKNFSKSIDDGIIVKVEKHFRKKNGERFWVELNTACITDKGQLKSSVATWLDITERKLVEAALRANEEHYRLLLDNSTAFISRVQMLPEMKMDYVSPSCLRITGYEQDEFYQNPNLVITMIHPEDKDLSQKHMSLSKRKVQKPVTVRLVRKDGQVVWVDQIHEAVSDDKGRVVAMHLIIRDITERVKMENELKVHRDHLEELVRERTAELTDLNIRMKHELKERQKAEKALLAAKDEAETANRAKSEFLARTSHEIRTPVHGVTGMIDLVLDGKLENEQRQYLKMAISSAEALLNVIDDILDLSKIEARQLEPEHENFDLRTTIEDTLDSMAVTAFNKDLELTCRLSGGVTTDLIGDAGRLRQVLINLIGNAIKFTEKGEVALCVEPVAESKKETELHFTVRDTGIGIPESKFDLIFEPFQQADGSINRKYGGTGLGLAISRHLIDQMGGRIWVEDGSPRGSIFHFTGKFARQTSGKRSGNGSKNELEARNVPLLLVDDNATSRLVVKDILVNWGFDVTDVDSGPAALRAMTDAGAPYRIIMLDKTMDGMDGFAVAERMLNGSAVASDIIMMLPSNSVSDDFSHCQKLGISNYVIKPIKGAALQKALLTALGKAPGAGEEREEEETIRKPADMPGLRVLIAEDNPTSQLIARKTMEKMGHQVEVARNGSEAVDMAEKGNFDLILMDAEMPVLNGLEATRMIRKHERSSAGHTPIIAMTAYAMKEDKKKCLEAGMDGYLSKPAKPEEINAVVAELFAGKEKPAGASESVSAVAANTAPAVDIEAARRIFGGDDALLREAVDLFLTEDYPEQRKLLREGLERRDAAAIRAVAHSLKGAARGIGGATLGEVALQLEELGREGKLKGARKLADRLEDEFKRFADYYSQSARN